MKNLLLIAYYFAPIGGVGVRRHHQLVRSIAGQGWQTTVVARVPGKKMPLDPGLLRELPASTQVLRARDVEFTLPQRFFWRLGWNKLASLVVGAYYPDFAVGWIPQAVSLGRKALREHSFDAIVSSGPPHSTHVVARRLAREFALPWVIDYRDEWSDNPYAVFATPLHRKAVARLEHDLLSEADRVITATRYFTQRVQARTEPSKVFTLSNGYSDEDFAGLRSYARTDRFTIGYVGSFYGMNSPHELFRALGELVESKRIDPRKIRFVHVGTGRYEIPAVLRTVVEQTGFVAHQAALEAMQGADLLTLILPDPAPQSGKIFEYLRTGRPVLAITPEGGTLAELVHETKAGTVVEPGAHEAMLAAIWAAYRRWEQGLPAEPPDPSKVAAYEWGRLSQAYLGHIEAAITAHGRKRAAALQP